MVIKIKRNLSPLFYKALGSGAAQREEEHENLRGTAGGIKQAGRMHAALWKGRQMSSVVDTKTRELEEKSPGSLVFVAIFLLLRGILFRILNFFRSTIASVKFFL